MIIKLIGLFCFFIVIPVLFGMLQNKIRGLSDISVEDTYINGYITFFSFFWLITIIPYRHWYDISLQWLVNCWKLIIPIVFILLLICLNRSIIKQAFSAFKNLLNIKNEGRLRIGITYGIYFIAIILSVFVLVPSIYDNTVENAIAMINDNSMVATSDEGMGFSFPALFYVVGAQLFNTGITQVVHIFLPIALMPLFLFTQRKIGRMVFEEEKNQDMFFFVIMLFYFVLTFSNAHIGLVPFQNIWNGITLCMSCILPLFVVYTTELVLLRRSKDRDYTEWIQKGITLLMLAVSAEMLMPFGAGMSFIIFIIGMIIA